MYVYVLVCMRMYMHVSVRMSSSPSHYMYASADAVTTGPKHPPAGRQPACPTQYTHEQQPRHLIPRSGTHSQTRFGALMRARVRGGGLSSPPAAPMGPPRAEVAC